MDRTTYFRFCIALHLSYCNFLKFLIVTDKWNPAVRAKRWIQLLWPKKPNLANIKLFSLTNSYTLDALTIGNIAKIENDTNTHNTNTYVWFMSFWQGKNNQSSVECLFWFFQLTWKSNLKVVQITKDDLFWGNAPLYSEVLNKLAGRITTKDNS